MRIESLLLALLCLIWGSTWLVIKIGLDGVPPLLSAGLRFALASSVLFVLVWIKKRSLRLTRDDKISIASCGLLSYTLSYAGVYWAERRIPSGLTAMMYCTGPLQVALLSRFWTRSETLGGRKAAGILLGMLGSAVLFLPGLDAGGKDAAAILVAFASASAAALNLVVIKRHAARTDTYVMNACGMGIGSACLLLTSLATEPYSALRWTPRNVLAVVYLALFGSVTAFMTFYHLLKSMEATRLSLVNLIYPMVAVGLGWLALGERVSPLSLLGMVLILAGVGLATRPAAG